MQREKLLFRPFLWGSLFFLLIMSPEVYAGRHLRGADHRRQIPKPTGEFSGFYQSLNRQATELKGTVAPVTNDKKAFPPFYGYLQLVGVMFVSKTSKHNEVILKNILTGEQTRYQEKMYLPFSVRIKNIAPTKVTLEKNGKLKEFKMWDRTYNNLALGQLIDAGYIQVGKQQWVVNAHGLFESSEELLGFIIESGIAMKGKDGAFGLRIGGAQEGSKIAQLGFHTGDQVLSVNGVAISGKRSLLNAYLGIRRAEKVTISIDRQGKKSDLSYWVATKGKIRYDMKKIMENDAVRKLIPLGALGF